MEAIEIWVEHYDDGPNPFIWKKPAEGILAKVRRGHPRLITQTESLLDDR